MMSVIVLVLLLLVGPVLLGEAIMMISPLFLVNKDVVVADDIVKEFPDLRVNFLNLLLSIEGTLQEVHVAIFMTDMVYT